MVTSVILLLALFLATITDLRTTEVPDWISYGAIIAGLLIATTTSIIQTTFTPLVESLIGLLIYGSAGLALFYLGQWGGGDAKLMIGAGALIGATTEPLSQFAMYPIAIMIAGGIYSLIWSATLAIKHHRIVGASVKLTYQHRGILTAQATLTLIGAMIIIIGALSSTINTLGTIMLGTIIPASLALFITLKSVEKHCFRKTISADQLMEGDWVLTPIKKNGRTLYTPSKTGITTPQITMLRREKIRHIDIKYGIPFVPALFIAYIPLAILSFYGILVS